MPKTSGTGASRGALVALLVWAAGAVACADQGSELAVVYRGDVAAWRSLVRVQLGSGREARVATPAFPSAARPEPVATSGELPVVVTVLTATGDTAVRYSVPSLQLATRRGYQLGIVIGQRPAASECNGAWAAAAITRPLDATGRASPPDSLYVSVTTTDRTRELPRCDD